MTDGNERDMTPVWVCGVGTSVVRMPAWQVDLPPSLRGREISDPGEVERLDAATGRADD